MATCPFCNALLGDASPAACPRCGEKLNDTPSASPTPGREPISQPLWFRLGFFASCVVSTVVLVAGLAWVNRERPAASTVPPPDVGPATVSPLGVPALGYLSPKTNAVAALQMRPLAEYAKRVGIPPKRLLGDLGMPVSIIDDLAAFGLPFESIDHFALGFVLDSDNAIPGVTIVAVLNSAPADPNAVVAALAKSKWPGVTAVWLDAKTLAIGTNPDAVPKAPKPPGAEHFSSSLRETIGKQVSPASWGWLATDSQMWAESPTVKSLVLVVKKPDLAASIGPLRAFAAGVSLEPEFTFSLALNADDAATAKRWRDHFGQRGAGLPCLIGGEDRWATVDLATSPGQIAATLARFWP
jgi:hypothetical protein